jgi:hypothetical protein
LRRGQFGQQGSNGILSGAIRFRLAAAWWARAVPRPTRVPLYCEALERWEARDDSILQTTDVA